MNIKARFIQSSCHEWDKIDPRRTNAVSRYKPDIILFEKPPDDGINRAIFNNYDCAHKPLGKVREMQADSRTASKKFGYALSEVAMWNNIVELWQKGHEIKLYDIDAPSEVFHEGFPEWINGYPRLKSNWLWWARIYLREKYMVKNFESAFLSYRGEGEPMVSVFIEKFHWLHLKFLLTKPSKREIWQYYFGRFPKLTPQNIGDKLKQENKIFYKHWQKVSDFV